jgi:hypothetical protein
LNQPRNAERVALRETGRDVAEHLSVEQVGHMHGVSGGADVGPPPEHARAEAKDGVKADDLFAHHERLLAE